MSDAPDKFGLYTLTLANIVVIGVSFDKLANVNGDICHKFDPIIHYLCIVIVLLDLVGIYALKQLDRIHLNPWQVERFRLDGPEYNQAYKEIVEQLRSEGHRIISKRQQKKIARFALDGPEWNEAVKEMGF